MNLTFRKRQIGKILLDVILPIWQNESMNALEQYFSETGESPSSLAERIGRAPSSLTRALKGERNVSMNIAMDVERGTGGRVTAADFLAICLDAKRSASLFLPTEPREVA